MARESSLWQWLVKAKYEPDLRGRLDLRRVEDSIGAGFPDVDGAFVHGVHEPALGGFVRRGVLSFKLELKSEVRPARASTPIRFKVQKRFAQLEFMQRRYDMGEAAYFFLQVGEGADAMRYLLPGNLGGRLRDGVNESELAVLCATENGMVFDRTVKPAIVIERIQTCYSRR